MITLEVKHDQYPDIVMRFTGPTEKDVLAQADAIIPPAKTEYELVFHPYSYKIIEEDTAEYTS